MSALSTIIAAAVADAIAANPKLFDPKKIERAPEVLTRDIVKALTRSPKEAEAEAQAEAETPPFEMAPAESPLAKAYINLRLVAGCLARHAANASGAVYVPREGNNAAVLAFADVPAPDAWRTITKPQQTAWHEFFERVLPGANRRPLGDATPLPWPWPPSKEGKTYDAAEAPAEQLDGIETP